MESNIGKPQPLDKSNWPKDDAARKRREASRKQFEDDVEKFLNRPGSIKKRPEVGSGGGPEVIDGTWRDVD